MSKPCQNRPQMATNKFKQEKGLKDPSQMQKLVQTFLIPNQIWSSAMNVNCCSLANPFNTRTPLVATSILVPDTDML